jgi:hypothetical protein
MAEAEATLVSAGSRFYDGSTNSQKGTQSSTELQKEARKIVRMDAR